MNDQVEKNDLWLVRRLTRRRKDGTLYVREPRVDAQMRTLCALAEPTRRARLVCLDRDDADFVAEETVVCCLREYARRGDDGFAWHLADILAQRVAGHVRRELARWRLTPEDADDCIRDLFALLFDAVFDTSETGEFWEVRFWVCLDRKLWNLAEKRQREVDAFLADRTADDGEERDDLLTRQADTTTIAPDALAEHKAAWATLAENERMALFLRHIEGLPEESEDPATPSIARALGVTGRSVRNYLRRAESKLRAWSEQEERLERP